MAEHSHIEWTDATWNPVTGCSVVSPGCTNCYAMKLAGTRLRHHPSRAGLTVASKAGPVWNGKVRLNEEWLDQPLRWKRPRMIFVCAHGDLFHESVPDEWIDKVFTVMALAPQHTFQVLTKRAARMRAYLSRPFIAREIHELLCDRVVEEQIPVVLMAPGVDDPALMPSWPRIRLGAWPLPNVWLGVSAERQQEADIRIPDLLASPAAIRFISAEPLLGSIDLRQWQHSYGCGCGWGGNEPLTYCRECGWRGWAAYNGDDCPSCGQVLSDFNACPECDGHDGDWCSFGPNSKPKLDWVIVGGESGKDARPMHPAWARSLRDQCAKSETPFFFKQWGEWMPDFEWGGQENLPDDDPEQSRFPTCVWDAEAGRWDRTNGTWCDTDSWVLAEDYWQPEQTMTRYGKRDAGRMLEGVEHNAMPQTAGWPAHE